MLLHILDKTNLQFREKEIRLHANRLSSEFFQINMKDLMNYYAICLSFELVKQPSKTSYWDDPQDSDGLLGKLCWISN